MVLILSLVDVLMPSQASFFCLTLFQPTLSRTLSLGSFPFMTDITTKYVKSKKKNT